MIPGRLFLSFIFCKIWWCLERLGTEGLLIECCDYLSRNLLLAMVSNEIMNIRQGAPLTSCLLFESSTETTGVKSVLSLIQVNREQNQVEVNQEKESSSDSTTSLSGQPSHALRVPVQPDMAADSDIHLSRPMRSLLVFLRDISQTLEFISESVFNGESHAYS